MRVQRRMCGKSLDSACQRASRTGFTIIELLVVIAIIGVLIALLMPAIQAVRQRSRSVACANRLKQIGIAIQHHQSEAQCVPQDGKNGYSYLVFLLPHLEQKPLYDELSPGRTKREQSTPQQQELWQTALESLRCSSFDQEGVIKSNSLGRSTYPGNREIVGEGIDLANVLDGESTTVAVWESLQDLPWVQPLASNFPTSADELKSRHGQGCNVLMCDGAVRFINSSVASNILTAISTANGNETVGEF